MAGFHPTANIFQYLFSYKIYTHNTRHMARHIARHGKTPRPCDADTARYTVTPGNNRGSVCTAGPWWCPLATRQAFSSSKRDKAPARLGPMPVWRTWTIWREKWLERFWEAFRIFLKVQKMFQNYHSNIKDFGQEGCELTRKGTMQSMSLQKIHEPL